MSRALWCELSPESMLALRQALEDLGVTTTEGPPEGSPVRIDYDTDGVPYLVDREAS